MQAGPKGTCLTPAGAAVEPKPDIRAAAGTAGRLRNSDAAEEAPCGTFRMRWTVLRGTPRRF
jgi:hypothetical protein